MNTRSTLTTLAFASLASIVAAACGSPQVPDVGATPPAPPAPPETAAPAATTPPAPAAEAGAPAAPAKMTAAECDALVDDANVAMDAERIAVDKVCKKDADCMPIKGRACSFVCQTGAIPKAEEKDWTDNLKKVNDNQCKKWADNDCAKTSPPKKPPTCPDDGKKPACAKGHCILK